MLKTGIALLALCAVSITAVQAASPGSTMTGAITGRIVDAATGEGLGWVSVQLPELRHGVSSHANGEFHLYQIPPGRYELHVSRIGYRDVSRPVTVTAGDTLYLLLQLATSPHELAPVETVAEEQANGAVLHQPAVNLSGGELQRELGITVAESVDEEPGIALRSMGPAPARPVLRGLSADRLLLLEDGQRTGDLSATSSDHAVAVEPLAAERLEVIRGPEALLYGSGALGGIVNVQRELIPMGKPHRLHGAASLAGESVHEGMSGGLSASVPMGTAALKLDGTLRTTGNVHTPRGELRNTALDTRSGGAGLSVIRAWGIVGAAGSLYGSEYGIPGGFVGAHPNGVSIEMERRHAEARAVRYFDGFVRRIEAEYSFSRYHHAEYESNGSLGMEYGVLTDNATLHFHHAGSGLLSNGLFGTWIELRNYATGGLTFTPETDERQHAVFLYERGNWHGIEFQGTLRWDWKAVSPRQERTSSIVGLIRSRSFDGFSGAFQGDRKILQGLRGGMVLTSAWRAPGVEELFSEGPHLAAYSYEIGNPNLNAENGMGIEAFADFDTPGGTGRLSVFHNRYEDFIFPQNTGHFSSRRADLYEYRYQGMDASFNGAELSGTWDVLPRWRCAGSGSYVAGTLTGSRDPLPQIPPLSGQLSIEYHRQPWSVRSELHGAAAQRQTAEFERPTASWLRLDLSLQVLQPWHGGLHSLALTAENLFDTDYRRHLSRVKEIMPEPGRGVQALYRLHF